MATQTVAAVFDRYEQAASAVAKLESAGVAHSDVSIVSNDSGQRERYDENGNLRAPAASTGAGTGATLGTVVGGGAGLLAGLGLLAIPGLGPVVAAGWIVSTLVGAGVGAAAGGIVGSLTGAGISEPDAHAYAEAVHRGGTLVTVRASDALHETVVGILEREGAVDLDDRANAWRSEGWTGSYAGDDAPVGAAADRARVGGTSAAGMAGAELGVTDPVTGMPGVAPPPDLGTPPTRPRVRSYPQS